MRIRFNIVGYYNHLHFGGKGLVKYFDKRIPLLFFIDVHCDKCYICNSVFRRRWTK